MSEDLYIVFDGPPSHESGRFVEVEIACGKSVRAGKWEEYPGKPGLWRLGPFTEPAPSPSAAHADLLAEAEYGADGDLCCEMEACMTYHAENGEPPCPCPCHFAYAQRTIRRLAAALRAAFPSPGAVEAAYREGWRNAYENTDPELGGHGCDEYWLASAARRGAAGGQDG